ncbi:MAG: hypothetical protein H7Y15_08030, partial [Pseudonocardia sp.]|nr:hypothetical protein [Pseudonocardia sp.]
AYAGKAFLCRGVARLAVQRRLPRLAVVEPQPLRTASGGAALPLLRRENTDDLLRRDVD